MQDIVPLCCLNPFTFELFLNSDLSIICRVEKNINPLYTQSVHSRFIFITFATKSKNSLAPLYDSSLTAIDQDSVTSTSKHPKQSKHQQSSTKHKQIRHINCFSDFTPRNGYLKCAIYAPLNGKSKTKFTKEVHRHLFRSACGSH